MRLLWELGAGLPRPLTNMPIFTLGGRHIGTPDLLDPVSGVLGEYDGGLHLAGDRRARDIRREAVFREHGLEPVTMVAEDRIDNRAFLDRLRAAYRRARRRLTSDRNWTVVPPPWWGYDAHRQAGVRG